MHTMCANIDNFRTRNIKDACNVSDGKLLTTQCMAVFRKNIKSTCTGNTCRTCTEQYCKQIGQQKCNVHRYLNDILTFLRSTPHRVKSVTNKL